jgi:hypothetical protein
MERSPWLLLDRGTKQRVSDGWIEIADVFDGDPGSPRSFRPPVSSHPMAWVLSAEMAREAELADVEARFRRQVPATPAGHPASL